MTQLAAGAADDYQPRASSARYNAGYIVAAQGWKVALGVVAIPLQLRLLGAEAYGLLGFLAAYEVASQVVDNCLSLSVMRDFAHSLSSPRAADEMGSQYQDLRRSKARSLASGYEGLFALYAIGALILLGVGSAIMVPRLTLEQLSTGIVWEAAILLMLEAGFRVMASGYRAMHQGMELHSRMVVLTTTAATLRWVGGLAILAFWLPDIRAFLLWSLACQVFEALSIRTSMALVIGEWRVGSLESIRNAIVPAWPFVRQLALMSLVSIILNQADRVTLSLSQPMSQLGGYYFAKNMAGGFAVFSSAVASAWLPRFSGLAAAGDRTQIAREYRNTTNLLMAFCLPLATVAVLRAANLLVLLGGPGMESSEWTLRLFVIGFVLYVMGSLCHALLLALGRADVPLRINLFALPVVWTSTYLSVGWWGGLGAAFVFAGLNVAVLVASLVWTSRRLVPLSLHPLDLLWRSLLAVLPVYVMHTVFTSGFSGLFGVLVDLGVALLVTVGLFNSSKSAIEIRLNSRAPGS